MTLREAREARGWTLNEAATRAKISRTGLENIEAGKTAFGDVRLSSALRLLLLYWPDVRLVEALGHPDGPPPEKVDETTLFDLVPRDRWAFAHMLADSTSDWKIARE